MASRGAPCGLKRASPGWGSRSGPGPSSTVTPQRGRPLSLWFSAEISCSLVSFTFLKPGHGVSCQILSDLAASLKGQPPSCRALLPRGDCRAPAPRAEGRWVPGR